MNDVSFIEGSSELGPGASPLRCDVTRSHTVSVSGNEQTESGSVRSSAYVLVKFFGEIDKLGIQNIIIDFFFFCRVKIATQIKANRDEFQTF